MAALKRCSIISRTQRITEIHLLCQGAKIRKDFHEVFVDIADEAGGIAVLASLLAFNGINIKNIGIINNREF